MTSRDIYISTEKIDNEVLNAYPNVFVVEGDSLKDYKQQESTEAHVSFITRPLTYGSDRIKKLERIILRGIFYGRKSPVPGEHSVAFSSHSNDGINFRLLRAMPLKDGDARDYDMGMIMSGKYRMFLYAFGAILNEDSQLQYIDSLVDTEYDNGKLR